MSVTVGAIRRNANIRDNQCVYARCQGDRLWHIVRVFAMSGKPDRVSVCGQSVRGTRGYTNAQALGEDAVCPDCLAHARRMLLVRMEVISD